MNQFHLWPQEPTIADGSVTASVTIENPDGKRQQLWYRFPEQYCSLLTASCDPFVLAILFTAMERAADVVVHGQVSPSLLRNLEEYQAIWSCWRPEKYRAIEITADLEQERSPTEFSDRALSTFSGGIDSCFTVLRHRRGLCGRRRRNLQAGIAIHGFDISLDKPEEFDFVVQQARKILSSEGMELIPVVTNFRQLLYRDRWYALVDCHGACLASILMLFQGGVGTGLIPSGEPYQSLPVPWGSHPMLDSLLSSDSFSIIHDGAEFSRIQKIEQLAQWPEALAEIQVCWEMPERGGNCGCCEKCIRTILGFRVLGLDLPGGFVQDASDRQIFGLSLQRLQKTQRIELELILETAKAKNISDSWVRALKIALTLNPSLTFLKELLKSRLPKLQ